MIHSKSTLPHSPFPKYERYKDSGFEWLGKVPEHWDVQSLRAVAGLYVEKNQPDLPVLSVYREYGVILKDSRDDNHNATSLDTLNYKVVRPGDLAVNKMKAWQGSLGVSEHHGIVSPAYITCRLNQEKVTGRYIHYLLRSKLLIGALDSISYGVRVGQWDMRFEDFKKVGITIPPKPEQDHIVAFLDQKTAEIDALIAKKQRQIELLDEQKAILINRAVTRGLNPNAKLKPSGIEWLDEIPEHWGRKPIKNLLSSIDYGTSQSSYEGGKIPVLSIANIQNGIVTDANAGGIDSIDPWLLIRKHDILFTRTNGNPNLVGKVGVVTDELPNETTFASYLVRFRTNAGTNPTWLHRLLWSENFWTYARSFALINLQTNLNSTKYVNLRIAVPPLAEQTEIAKWCDRLIGQEKRVCGLISEEIGSLKTLRSTLISHAVTGRIKI